MKEHAGDTLPKGWHHMSHGHHAWGNDSHESIERFDVCSIDCFTKQLGQILIRMKSEAKSAEIAEMDYEFAKSLYDALNIYHAITH